MAKLASPPYFSTISLSLAPALVERLGQRDAHPTGIVLSLGVGALHAVAQAVGVVQGQHGRLRLRAAVAAAVSVGLVAFHFDDLVVLHGHPDAALHLAARAAARANALDLSCGRILALGQRGGRRGGKPHRARGSGHGGGLHEAAAREREFRHMPLLSFPSFPSSCCGPSAGRRHRLRQSGGDRGERRRFAGRHVCLRREALPSSDCKKGGKAQIIRGGCF